MPSKKLFLLDAMALIYRAHFAFSKTPRINSKGMNTGAAFGFLNTLLEIINKEKPTHIAVGFDSPGGTFRNEQFSDYKANRQEQPEDITIAIPICMELIRGFGIPILILPGFEADDIIGTFAKKAAREDFEVYMMTSDKDYGQLVEEHIFVYRPAFMGNGPEIYDIEKVCQKFGIKHVDQVRDILGLQGDAVDNIPGIPGIGAKTAVKLIEEYGSIENLIANSHELKGKLRENVETFAAQGLMSKELATIFLDVPIAFDETDMIYTGAIKEQLVPLFEELEFRNLHKRVFGEELPSTTFAKPSAAAKQGQLGLFDAPIANTYVVNEVANTEEIVPERVSYKTIDNTMHAYHIMDTPDLHQGLISYLLKQKEFCFDTETTSLDTINASLVGISFSYTEGEAYYVPIPADQSEAQKIVDTFKEVFENKSILKIGQNIKFDILILKNYGIEVQGELFDTMLAHYLIDPDTRHGMDVLAETYLGYKPVSITELIGKKGKGQGNMRDIPVEEIAEYAGEDADITLQLKHIFTPELNNLGLVKLFTEVENPLIKVLANMEREGVKIDVPALKEFSLLLGKDISVLESQIHAEAGVKFNIASPKQMGEVLFDKLKLDPKAKKTKTGQYATGEEILSKLAFEHKIIRDILEYREMQKLKSTYVDALPELIYPKDGRIHTSYNQAVAATGRLSSTNPNLQNIPVRSEKGKEIRKAFVPRNEDYLILSADYSQIELRIIASLSKDESMIEAFRSGVDIHSATAAKVFKVDLEEVTSDMRRKAKMVNFGIIYGISAFGLSQRLDIPRKEAAEIIEAYFQEFSIKKYMDEAINTAREIGYVETILGRRRYLRDINSANATIRGYAERNAINAPIQGSAADIIKVAMIQINDWMQAENLKSKMILQVHDELVFDAHKEEVDYIRPKIEAFMKNAIPLLVPMEIGIGVGENWLIAH
ncbi:MAG: polymerase [Bacteroidota bacterium]